MNSCRFAAVVPILNIIAVNPRRDFMVTSVPNLVRNTTSNINLNRRFLGRVRHYHVLIRMISITNDRKESPGRSFRGVGRRLMGFGPRLTGYPRVITNGGVSLTASRRLRSFGDFVRGGKLPCFPVITPVGCNAGRLVGTITRGLSALPPMGGCRTRRVPLSMLRDGGGGNFGIAIGSNMCSIRTS